MTTFYIILGEIFFGILCAMGIILGGFAIASLAILVWRRYLLFLWFKIKHLFPRWQFDEDWYKEALTREDVILKRKNRFVILKFKKNYKNAPFGTKCRYILITKK